MSNATQLPDLFFGQWARPNAGFPALASPILSTQTAPFTITFTEPLLDENGDAPTKAVLIGVTTAQGYTEHFYIAPGDIDSTGLSATVTARGVRLSGLDFTTGDSSLVVTHNADEKVFVAVEGVYEAILNAVLRGDSISTGGNNFTIGLGADNTITIKRNTDGTEKGWLRWDTTLDKVQYSNDGSNWISIDDAIVGYLVKASVADTTPGYLGAKLTAGTGISLTLLNPGANETIEIALTQNFQSVTEHETYTPAYLTGGTNAQNLFNQWLSVLNGSFRITINGVTHNCDAINFTGVTSMSDVAAKIQTAINTAFGAGEATVAWSTNRFIITSLDTTVASAISVTTTSTGTVGTDISGAGANNWMDCDTGNGVATAAVLDLS